MKTVVELTREAGGFDATPKFLERFAELVRAGEREACAKVCENYDIDIAAAIRARTEQ